MSAQTQTRFDFDLLKRIGVDSPLVAEDRLACTFSCNFDDGRRVVANSLMDLRDGRIVRQFDVQARDL
jgi:hypothetical protein